ncbi:hypothetical protein LXM63_04405 [Chryseobacterium gleum]|uniref:hypothetical protein n=1 Tax=Chryseobacterium gleum TaxID=250 RepID=UPI001E2D1B3F|nr:hypothetical protein [Chryseobacterium gleum]MCE4064324.1 hypothetical protein [Chryseobacterium gleum]
MKELEELTREIREKLPRLTNVKEYKMNDGSKRQFGENYPVLLYNVLYWLQVKSQSDFEPGDKRYLTHFLAFKLSEWDLSTPYLEDQSPEVIKFLHGLIKNR